MMALDAEVEITSVRGARRVSVNQFYTGYRKTVLAPDEIVTRVRIPLLKSDETLKLYKVSRRKDLDIATFGAAFWMRRTGQTIDDIRIAYGGVGPVVVRMSKTETSLRGASVTSLDRFEEAGRVAASEVTPISDVRGSKEFRSLLARNIVVKLWHEISGCGEGGNGRFAGKLPPGAGLRQLSSTGVSPVPSD
jgi:xanthine dehydrogenase small subunit